MSEPDSSAEVGPGTRSEQERLQLAERAFAHGDYHALRRLISELRSSQAPEIQHRVSQLTRAVAPDRVHLLVLLGCLLILLAIFAHYVLR